MITIPRGLLLAVAFSLVGGRLLAATPATPDAMNKLYADYWEEFSAQNPIEATFNGDNRFNDRFGATTSAQGNAEKKALAEKYLARTAQFDPAALPSEDRISYDLSSRRSTGCASPGTCCRSTRSSVFTCSWRSSARVSRRSRSRR